MRIYMFEFLHLLSSRKLSFDEFSETSNEVAEIVLS